MKQVLPLRYLHLIPSRCAYKNGVGYFEHRGQVRGSESVHIEFTSAQLNNVWKSLTVLDLSGGRITGAFCPQATSLRPENPR
jgi:hypothetical protein